MFYGDFWKTEILSNDFANFYEDLIRAQVRRNWHKFLKGI